MQDLLSNLNVDSGAMNVKPDLYSFVDVPFRFQSIRATSFQSNQFLFTSGCRVAEETEFALLPLDSVRT